MKCLGSANFSSENPFCSSRIFVICNRSQKATIQDVTHDEHVDPEVHFMSADGLKAEHDRLQKMGGSDTKDWPSMEKIMEEEHEHEDDPEHFVMNDQELDYQKVLKRQQKAQQDKEDDIRHHAWE